MGSIYELLGDDFLDCYLSMRRTTNQALCNVYHTYPTTGSLEYDRFSLYGSDLFTILSSRSGLPASVKVVLIDPLGKRTVTHAVPLHSI